MNPKFTLVSQPQFSDLQPPAVKEELQQREDGDVKVQVVSGVMLGRVQKLTTDQAGEEEGVDGERDDLKTNISFRVLMGSQPSCGM